MCLVMLDEWFVAILVDHCERHAGRCSVAKVSGRVSTKIEKRMARLFVKCPETVEVIAKVNLLKHSGWGYGGPGVRFRRHLSVLWIG